MTIPVELAQLRREADAFGPHPYLVTVSAEGTPHAVAVTVAWDGDELRSPVGKRTAANAGARPDVTLLWAPREEGGYTLIVDGTASVTDDDSGTQVSVRPHKAVLHRPAPSPTTPAEGSCGNDCVPVLGP